MKDIFSLNGKVALVTGGSRGIGAMIVQGFLEHGCSRVYITARKAAQCDAAAKELSMYGECISIPGDVSTQDGIASLVAEISKRESKLDILVNNAGAAWGAEFDEFPESGWDKTVDLNMKTPFFLTQALAPLLRAASSKDRLAKVINIASIDGLSVNPWETYSYAASKAGLIHLTKLIAVEYGKYGIRANAVAPGTVRTQAWQARAAANPQVFEEAKRWYALRRIATAEAELREAPKFDFRIDSRSRDEDFAALLDIVAQAQARLEGARAALAGAEAERQRGAGRSGRAEMQLAAAQQRPVAVDAGDAVLEQCRVVALGDEGDLVAQIGQAVVHRRGREHEHPRLDPLADDLAHQPVVARLGPLLGGLFVAEIVGLIDDD